MWRKIADLQKWLAKNRLALWWAVFIPVVSLILAFNGKELIPLGSDVVSPMLSLQAKIFNSVLLIVMARIAVVALEVVLIMICLLFPVLRVSREGIQWNKELEEELTEVSGEIAGEEITEIISQETWRWSLIHGWLRHRRTPARTSGTEPGSETGPSFLVRDLLNTLGGVFPDHRLSLTLTHDERQWVVLHPLLPRLVAEENGGAWNPETTLRLEIGITSGFSLLLNVYANVPEGFSRMDEQFLLVLSEVFRREIPPGVPVPEKWFENFELILLTPEDGVVYDDRG